MKNLVKIWKNLSREDQITVCGGFAFIFNGIGIIVKVFALKKVSLIIMSSTYNSKDNNTKTFYEVTSKLVFNSEAINKIIENKNYSILINELFLCSNN